MLLLISAALSLAMGVFVAAKGQEPRVKFWFLVICVSAAAVSAGLWVEVNVEAWTFEAARVNMTAGLALATAGLLSARVMCGLPFHLPVMLLLGAGVVINLATVWLTDAYFTGALIRYPWGIYVAGDPKFVSNPLLVSAIALYGLVNLGMNYRRAHPLDKNRTKYLFVAYVFLAFGLLDYVPHFGVDLFGGPISGISTPLFLSTFAYACLRYRLIDFRTMLGRGSGWALTIVMMVVAYALVVEGATRLLLVSATQAHTGAAVVVFLIWLTLGRILPEWSTRLVNAGEPDFEKILQRFSGEVMSILDEAALRSRTLSLCTEAFGAVTADYWDRGAVLGDVAVASAAMRPGLIESEVVRRAQGVDSAMLRQAEIIVPLRKNDELIGALAVGKHRDGKMLNEHALNGLQFLGNIYGMALAHARSAVELEKRHQLDRYLAPQIVEHVLSGDSQVIESKRRMLVTIFFSDLKGFSDLADRISPDTLSTVLNEYLSEMADIAFAHGGTVDKFIGDAVMVFFGAPVDSVAPQQAQQCIRMGAEMHRRTAELNVRWREMGLLENGLTSRMGVHTGEATVGSFGSNNRLEYTAIGRAVNLASRLEGQCTPGHILVSAETWALLDGKFGGKTRGKIRVKGFADEVEVWEIDPAGIPPSEKARTA